MWFRYPNFEEISSKSSFEIRDSFLDEIVVRRTNHEEFQSQIKQLKKDGYEFEFNDNLFPPTYQFRKPNEPNTVSITDTHLEFIPRYQLITFPPEFISCTLFKYLYYDTKGDYYLKTNSKKMDPCWVLEETKPISKSMDATIETIRLLKEARSPCIFSTHRKKWYVWNNDEEDTPEPEIVPDPKISFPSFLSNDGGEQLYGICFCVHPRAHDEYREDENVRFIRTKYGWYGIIAR